MAKSKTYQSATYKQLRVGSAIVFRNGVFTTDDPDQQASIEGFAKRMPSYAITEVGAEPEVENQKSNGDGPSMRWTADELRAAAEERGLDTTGTKQDIYDRLTAE